MIDQAINQARNDLQDARDSLERLQKAKIQLDLNAAWASFVSDVGRVYLRLETAKKQTKNEHFKNWYRAQEQIRDADQLMSYLHHARNAREHGLVPINPIGRSHLGPPNFHPIVGIHGETFHQVGVLVIRRVHVDPLEAKLYPIKDRSGMYDPPSEHDGKKIENANPVLVAKLAVSFLQKLIQSARQFAKR